MSDYIADPTGPDAAPIERIDQLIEHFERGAKPPEQWRVGTEYEKIAVDRRTGEALPFSGRRGIEALLRALADHYGWEPTEEDGRIIGLVRDQSEITLEPGGQLELAGQPFETIHEAHREFEEHVEEITTVAEPLDVEFLGLGIQPFSTLESIEWVPKKRYGIMGPYMTTVGSLGQRMMKQTATVQVNLDYQDERDAFQKIRVATGLSPIINAIFANSVICDGRSTGYLSYRGHIWTDTDPARCGLLPFLFEERAGFADYAEWALDVPMYFVKRGGSYRDLRGLPFRRYWKEGAGDLRATVGDFALHLSTLFPEVRLKTYIELRMVDSQPPDSMLALSAIAKAILYHPDCLLAAWDLVKGWSFEERVEIWRSGHRYGLRTPVRRHRLQDLARELLDIAEEGLARQNCRNEKGDTEAVYLESVRDRVRRGVTLSEILLERFENDIERSAATVVRHTSYRGARGATA